MWRVLCKGISMSRMSTCSWNLPEVAQGGSSVVLFCTAVVVVGIAVVGAAVVGAAVVGAAVVGVAVVDGCNVVNLLVD